jgi:hypothetical protein
MLAHALGWLPVFALRTQASLKRSILCSPAAIASLLFKDPVSTAPAAIPQINPNTTRLKQDLK